MLRSLWSLLFILNSLVFFTLITNPTYFSYVFSRLVLSSMCLKVGDIKARSSVKSRSSSILVIFHRIPVLLFLVTLHINYEQNKKPEVTHPCFTPDITLNHADSRLPSITIQSVSSYSNLMICINFSGMSYVFMISQRLS